MGAGKHAERRRRRGPLGWFLRLSKVRKAIGALAAAVVGVSVNDAFAAITSSSYTAGGTVRCASGARLVAVQILSSEGDDARADLQPIGQSIELVGGAGRFSYRLANGGSYRLHVGCGGTAGFWATANYTGPIQGDRVTVTCEDPPPVPGETPHGTCRVGR